MVRPAGESYFAAAMNIQTPIVRPIPILRTVDTTRPINAPLATRVASPADDPPVLPGKAAGERELQQLGDERQHRDGNEGDPADRLARDDQIVRDSRRHHYPESRKAQDDQDQRENDHASENQQIHQPSSLARAERRTLASAAPVPVSALELSRRVWMRARVLSVPLLSVTASIPRSANAMLSARIPGMRRPIGSRTPSPPAIVSAAAAIRFGLGPVCMHRQAPASSTVSQFRTFIPGCAESARVWAPAQARAPARPSSSPLVMSTPRSRGAEADWAARRIATTPLALSTAPLDSLRTKQSIEGSTPTIAPIASTCHTGTTRLKPTSESRRTINDKAVMMASATELAIRISIGTVWDFESTCATSQTSGFPRFASRFADLARCSGSCAVQRRFTSPEEKMSALRSAAPTTSAASGP